jgi:pimeloyl-ACP methyl ester carboxylesterase
MNELRPEAQDVRTDTLVRPGATLAYDIRAAEAESGAPALLMIACPMDASGFTTLATYFPDRTVVTYDPRGVSRSQRADGATWSTPEEHAEDLHRLISALDAGPLDIFASSGGAVNALALVARHAEQVRTLVAHEPPTATVLPDREHALAAIVDIHRTYERDGLGPGMANHRHHHSRGSAPGRLRRPSAEPSRLRPTDRGRRHLQRPHARRAHRRLHPLRARLRRPASRLDPHYHRCRSRVQGHVHPPRGARLAVAERLGSKAVIFPSHHGGFLGGEFGWHGQPDAFAATLRQVLGESG